jgi:hypothetical protein
MKKFVVEAMVALGLAAAVGAASATDVGVSVSISQPGVFGRVDIGRFPQPQLVVAQPVIVERPRVVHVRPEPVYMWVPPGHRKDWRKHCRHYNACGVPVYFVQDRWYQERVVHHDRWERDHERRDDHGQRHDHDRDDHRGHGHDKGHGKGHGKRD